MEISFRSQINILIQRGRKTRDSFTLRGSSVLGKPMEPRFVTTCSLYFRTSVNQFSVPTL